MSFGNFFIGLVGYFTAIILAMSGFYGWFRYPEDGLTGVVLILGSLCFAFVTKLMVGW